MPLKDSGVELADAERDSLLDFIRELQSRPDPQLGAVDPVNPFSVD